jgi:wyosine [tRNA(Phe)-imidazoG37] synthetase (radical SAM superfamily)
MNYKHLFGPVQSRRLGVSLGIDLVNTKLCSLDCVYCECGATVDLSLERSEHIPAHAIIAELNDLLSGNPALDYITFGGSGEPTLNTAVGPVVRFIKSSYPQYKCALLTNGTLLYLPEVRRELLPFDIVLPNLDAVSHTAFEKLNRPHKKLENRTIIEGLISFRREYAGTIWLEVFIVPGVNDTPSEIALIRATALRIKPDRLQINTLDRPGTCDWVTPAPLDRLQAIARDLSPLPVEIITRNARDATLWKAVDVSPDSLRGLIARRPSTVEEIAALTGITINETALILDRLLDTGAITVHSVENRTFYRIF